MKLSPNCFLMSAVYLSVVIAKRRRVPFMICPGMKSNSDLMIAKSARSRIECSKFCLDEPDCLSASYCQTADGYTCQLSGLYAHGSCTAFVPDVECVQTALVDPCENGGTFFPENRTCLCMEGYVGVYCHRYPRDCFETKQELGTFYFIEPLESGHIFPTLCDKDTTPITTISQSIPTISHSWQQFRDGFLPLIFPVASFTFCGLETLHLLTRQGMYDMSIIVVATGPVLGKLWYRNFRVNSEANGYSLSWDSVQYDPLRPDSYQFLDGFGGAGDTTKSLNGARFGTFDNDVNGCAQTNNAGWWFNPLGCTALQFPSDGLAWPTNRSGTVQTESLLGASLRIKPVFWYTEDDLVL